MNILLTITTILVILIFSLFFLNNRRTKILMVTAGDGNSDITNLQYDTKQEITTIINNKFISSYQKNIYICKVKGDSISKFKQKIENSNIIFVDSFELLSNLKKEDIFLIEKTKENGEKIYKLRSYDYFENNTIYSYTFRDGNKEVSEHPLSKLDRNGYKCKYIGKVIAKSENFINQSKQVA